MDGMQSLNDLFPRDNLITSEDIAVAAREIDFVTRFQRNWEHLVDIMGIMRPIAKPNGTKLKSKYAEGTLESGKVGEGELIPYSKFEVKEKDYEDITLEKFAKAVSIESIKDHGYEAAVQMTDDEFLFELQNDVTGRFYTYLNTGSLGVTGAKTYQQLMAKAQGSVINKFKQMHRTATGTVGFANVMDVYNYLGDAPITVQNEFGFNYIKNFLGYNTIFLLSDAEIKAGRFICTPVDNIVLYYVNPSDSEFGRAGLKYRTAGQTNLIGFHTQGNYNTAVSESFALMGMTLFAEYLDAIAVGDLSK